MIDDLQTTAATQIATAATQRAKSKNLKHHQRVQLYKSTGKPIKNTPDGAKERFEDRKTLQQTLQTR